MRLLIIHSEPFSFEVTEKTKHAEDIRPPVSSSTEAENALVAFVAVEKQDERDTAGAAAGARDEILKVLEKVSADVIVLYPYSHLSNNLARPGKALETLKKIREELSSYHLVACPFGWYKKFSLNGKGHPVSEWSRVIEPAPPASRDMASKTGREHPVAAMCQKFREVFLDLGLDEMINPAIVEEAHIYRQYGPEAPLILDRVFYLAWQDRADIGLGRNKLDQIRRIVPDFDREEDLRALFREYKEARIEADDFLEEMALRLKLSGTQTAEILDRVFPEFRELSPVPMKKTLRSHMTSNWFPVLQRLRGSWPLPVRIFSVGSRFRREQRQDPHHLFESTSASVVVMDKDLSLEDGESLVRDVLKKMGFRKCTFRKKKVASRYYDPETDTEVFVNYGGKQIEVGNLGFYAPASLENYDIDIPVFNIGFGVERMAMILGGEQDLRALVYPQFYEEISFDDRQIADLLGCIAEPESEELRGALPDMVAKAVAEKDLPGPRDVVLFEGNTAGRDLRIVLFNWDEGKPLLSMAAVNEVYVHDGNLYGLPPDRAALGDKFSDIYDGGVNSGLRFIDMIISGFASRVEKAALEGNKEQVEERWKIAKRPFQVNLDIPDEVYDYIQRLHRSIRVGGPLFFGLRSEWL